MMKYRIIKETKPTLATFGKYKAAACHYRTIESWELIRELTHQSVLDESIVVSVLSRLSDVISKHLREGDKVKLWNFGMMKLEIEGDKVDAPEDFNARKHIRGVRLHFLPESQKGSQALYQDIPFEKEKWDCNLR